MKIYSVTIGCLLIIFFFYCLSIVLNNCTGSIWLSCIHFLGINGRRGEEDWVPFTFAFFLSQKSSSQGRRPPFQLLVTFSHKARATLFFLALVYQRQTWGGFGSEIENARVAKKKTADILLELFERCVGHTEVYPCAGCPQQLLIRMRKRKKRTVSQWK